MTKTARRKRSQVLMATSAFCLLFVFDWPVQAQVATSAASAAPSPSPSCEKGASPGVIQLTPDATNPDNKLKLARKHFYLSSSPFNLANNVNLKTAPSLRSFYNGAGASPQLIEWLEENHCETIYCRELTADEVKCEGNDPKKCVPEFLSAYRNALGKLNGNQELARKWITNYEPLSSPKLRIGFFEANRDWLKSAVAAIEKGQASNYRIRSAITDKEGSAYFYDLCPGSYYVSSIAPINIEGAGIIWETGQIKVEGPPEVNKTTVTLAFTPGKVKKKNFFVGKPLAEVVNDRKTSDQ
jgi:uncharacterized protein (DUF2141 family)